MKSVFLSALFLAILFLVHRYIFEPTYLYYEFLWLDIPMHVLGGLGAGFLVLSLARLAGVPFSAAQLVAIYAVVAFGWEAYELARGAVEYDELWKYFDSLKDVALGALGFYSAYRISQK